MNPHLLIAYLWLRIATVAALVWHIVRPAPTQTLYRLALPAAPTEPTPELGDWDDASLAEVSANPDPLTGDLLFGEDLVDALIYLDLQQSHPVALDYAASTATQEWALAGARLAQLGDTQTFEAVR